MSMPGYNVTRQIRFENLPLPVPMLSGPAQLVMPIGVTTIAVLADPAVPFLLDLDEAYVNAHVDDTTRWTSTSSDPSDTMPGTRQQTNGQVALAMTFGSLGTRTITVRSIGDEGVTASLEVTVTRQSTKVFGDGFAVVAAWLRRDSAIRVVERIAERGVRCGVRASAADPWRQVRSKNSLVVLPEPYARFLTVSRIRNLTQARVAVTLTRIFADPDFRRMFARTAVIAITPPASSPQSSPGAR